MKCPNLRTFRQNLSNMTNQKERKLFRFMKAPLRFLIKARDMYVQGMTECSGHFAYVDAAMGCPTGQLCALPRSFSVTSARSSASDDDFKDLIRAASLRSQQNGNDPVGPLGGKVPRCRSVAIGRIDEDKPCDFARDEVEVNRRVYPRSRSYAARRGGAGLF